MNKKTLFALSAATSVVFTALTVLPASATMLDMNAQATMSATASTSITTKLDTAGRAKADTEITSRISALNSLETRINQMQKISANDKASLDTNLQAAVADMTNLKATIDADTVAATLKSDIQSITKSYRIYMLILPQGRIIAASDRIMTITGLLSDLSAKLQVRIAAAQAAGQNVTVLNASLSDMNAKTSDANVQAQAAISEVANLQPDNGNTTTFTSNQQAIKDARAKIKVATADLKTARQDAGSIVKSVEATKITASATSTMMMNQ